MMIMLGMIYYIWKQIERHQSPKFCLKDSSYNHLLSRVVYICLRFVSFAFSFLELGFFILDTVHQSTCISSSQCKHFEEIEKWLNAYQ
jgi:hypothetical protein